MGSAGSARKLLTGFLVLAAGAAAAPAAYGLALKNFREINAFYAVATAVNPEQNDVKAVYQSVRTRLALRGQISELSSAAVLATVELGGAYCKAMIANDAGLAATARRAHQAVNFSAPPAAATDDVVKQTATKYSQLLWGREPSAAELDSFVQSATRLKASTPATAAGTRQLFLILCTQAATSLDALIYE
jgi:hypothetical protein